MSERRSVVVTDVSTEQRLLRCVKQIIRTVPAGVEVLVVSLRKTLLPPALARRVRQQVVGDPDALDDVVAQVATQDRLVVVVRSDCGFRQGWFEGLVQVLDDNPFCVVGIAQDPVPLLAYPRLVRSVDAPPLPLPMIAGVQPRGEHHAHPQDDSPVTISASMIVKDEETVIEASVRAVMPLVDEVVVYDTGSTDRTVEIAEAAGATVVRGYWNDNFGDARNRSLDHCTGDWILVVDADEIAEGDGTELRAYLRAQTGDVGQATVVNTEWGQSDQGELFRPIRLFRRLRCRWSGALHETVVARDPGVTLEQAPVCSPLVLKHSGYQVTSMELHDKKERNLAIAAAAAGAWTGSTEDATSVWCNYGRTLAHSERWDEAMVALEKVLDHPGHLTLMVLAGRAAMLSLQNLEDRPNQIDRWLDVLTRSGEAPGLVATYRAWFLLRRHEFDAAEVLLAGVDTRPDIWGVPFDLDRVVAVRADIALSQGRPRDALDLVVDLACRSPHAVNLHGLLALAKAADCSVPDLVGRLNAEFAEQTLRQGLLLAPQDADIWFDALWTVAGCQRAVVAAEQVVHRLTWERAMVWELRAREVDATDIRPLRAFADGSARTNVERGLALAVLAEVQRDQESENDLRRLLPLMDEQERAELAGLGAPLGAEVGHLLSV